MNTDEMRNLKRANVTQGKSHPVLTIHLLAHSGFIGKSAALAKEQPLTGEGKVTGNPLVTLVFCWLLCTYMFLAI